MPDGEGGGGGGGGSSGCLPMEDLVEAMLSNSQALAEALAADRARREAADRIQRESWEAALKEKDAEIDRSRAEAAEANKKLQAHASRKMRWEEAYELLLGANQKLAELRDGDMEDSRTCANPPNSKEVESCTKLSQNTVDHTAGDFRKLKHDYETLNSKKDKEVSALLSENDSLRSQLDIMQQDNAKLLKNKKVEAAQALTLQKSVDELKMLAQKKDDEIARLQAEAVGAKWEHDTDLSALISEKDSVQNQLIIMQQDYTVLLKSKKVLNQKKDQEIVILRAEVVGAKKKVQQMHSLVKEKDDEIQRLKSWHVKSVQKHYKDISETHKKSRSGDPAVTVRDKVKQAYETLSSKKDKEVSALLSKKDSVLKQLNIMQQDYAVLMKNKEAAQATCAALKIQKSVNELKVLPRKKDDEVVRLRAEAIGNKNKLMKMQSLVKEKDDEIQRVNWHPQSIQKCKNDINKTHKKLRSEYPAARGKSKNYVGKGGQDETNQKRRRVSSISHDEDGNEQSGSDRDDGEQSGSDEDDGEQSGSVEDGDEQSGSVEDGDEQSGSVEDGDEQSGSAEDGDEQSGSDEDDDGQSRSNEHDNEQHVSDGDADEVSGSNEETVNNQVQNPLGSPKRKRDACSAQVTNGKRHNESNKVVKRWYSYRMAPQPLRSRKLEIRKGRRFFVHTGNWGNYVRLVNDSLVDHPLKYKEFLWFLCNFENWRVCDVIRTMEVVLDGQPKLIRQFNRFLPKHLQIEVEEEPEEGEEEEEEKQQPEEEEPRQRGVPRGQLPSAQPSPSASAAAGLIKLKESEQQPKREQV